MDQMSHHPYNQKKFHTLESAHSKKQRQNHNGNLLHHSISLDEGKNMKTSSQNGINGVLMRPLDLDGEPVLINSSAINQNNNLQNNIVSLVQQTALPLPPVPVSPTVKLRPGQPLAVEIRNVFKSYGPRNSRVHVLKGLNLTVPQGAM